MKQSWRYELDPRDPEYSEPPVVEQQEEEDEESYDDSDPRNHGPKNYQPMRNDV